MIFKKPKFWDYKKISIWVIILLPLTIVYQLIYKVIKFVKSPKQFPIPIICVGNIYLGGTGKTPLSREIFDISKSLNKDPAFIKKPYAFLDDEIKMLEKNGKVYTSKNRATSISLSINNNHNLAILDDGFQDFSIKPDLSILCFNSKQLIGNGFVIPSGPLRENLSSIIRAECVVINGEKNFDFENKIKKINKELKVFYSKYKIKNLEKLKNKKFIAFAGIGNPQNFFDLLKENNLNIIKEIPFPDHHYFSEDDYNFLLKENKQDTSLLTTEKDYLRLNETMKKNFDYIEVELKIENKDRFVEFIKSKI